MNVATCWLTNLASAANGSVIAGIAPGRSNDDEVIVFDSTGTALQDVAAAAVVYEKAVSASAGTTAAFW